MRLSCDRWRTRVNEISRFTDTECPRDVGILLDRQDLVPVYVPISVPLNGIKMKVALKDAGPSDPDRGHPHETF